MEAYITNLGKYNEGELVGKWISLPISEEELEQVLQEIGINEEYEEYFFTDYDCEVSLNLGEYESIEHLNELAEKLESDVIKAVAELYGIEGAMETDEDDWIVYFYIHTDYDLGYYIIEESGCYDTSELGNLSNYIDYEAFGRDVRLEAKGGFTSLGWLQRC